MTWNAFHRRGDVLREVVRAADQRRDGHLPLDISGVAETFVDDVDLIGALLLKWHARLSGNIERALVHEPMDLPAAVASAWRQTAEDMPGVRLVVDRASEAPSTAELELAMRRAQRAERVRLAQAAGLANDAGDRAAEAVRRIEEQARTGLPVRSRRQERVAPEPAPAAPVPTAATTPEVEPAARERDSFVERIKAVIAA